MDALEFINGFTRIVPFMVSKKIVSIDFTIKGGEFDITKKVSKHVGIENKIRNGSTIVIESQYVEFLVTVCNKYVFNNVTKSLDRKNNKENKQPKTCNTMY